MTQTVWSLHTHSHFSVNDAMSSVPDLVARAVELGYPALGLTDHGNPSGSVELYKNCRKAGIEPLPGMEVYVNADRTRGDRRNYHLTIACTSERGYRNLIMLHNRAQRQFFYKPMLDLADFADLSETGGLDGLVLGTGCFFGVAQQLITHRGPEAAKQVIAALAGWFPQVLVELHDHGIQHPNGFTDADMALELVTIADELGLPYYIAMDNHYLLPEEQVLHDSLKELITWSDDPSEAKFPGGPYSLLGVEDLQKIWDPEILGRSCDTLRDLAESSHVVIPELDNFELKVPDVTHGGDPDAILRARVMTALDDQYYTSKKQEKAWRARAASELDVIITATMSGYILLVADLCAFMRREKIMFRARGSAGGSLVTKLLEITQVDPIRWELYMERFMGSDRTRPPDIDLDVERKRRAEAIAWLQDQFATQQVGSYMSMKLTTNEDPDVDDKGSLLIRYFTSQRKRGKVIKTWAHVPPEDKAILRSLAGMELYSGYGTHAAGYIVAPDRSALSQLPLTWMPKVKRSVTAYDKKAVEALGFCKLDLLGLRTLEAQRITLEAIIEGRQAGRLGGDRHQSLDDIWDTIPDRDAKTSSRLAAGNTAGIFQLDGRTFARACRDMRPTGIEDCVAMQALYRPAILAAGGHKHYLARRAGTEPIPSRNPRITAITQATFGIPIYQEQIIALLRQAGMSPDELTDTLDAVKASNKAVTAAALFLEKTKPRIEQLLREDGYDDTDLAWFLDGLRDYADYSFNKAHSAQYGEAAWRSAYLATYYPHEFWLGVLTAYDDDKREAGFIRAARQNGVLILPPHVNTSGVSYRLDFTPKPVIRRGLLGVKMVGDNCAQELVKHQPFTSLRDIGERVVAGKVTGAKHLALGKTIEEAGGQILALHTAHALDGLA